jgi:nicotinamide riboside transporter PnuC
MPDITWLFTIMALYGTWLNAQGRRDGFWWWIVSDVAIALTNFQLGQYALGTLFSIYTILAIKGLNTWKKLERA